MTTTHDSLMKERRCRELEGGGADLDGLQWWHSCCTGSEFRKFEVKLHRREVLGGVAPENLLFAHGRGIYLMKRLMDEATFEDGGSVVRMRKNTNGDFSPSNESSRGYNATILS